MDCNGCWRNASPTTPRRQRKSKVHLVRYADDFLITGISKELLRDQVQPLVAHFLKERGLELSHEKTQITHIEDGFDFLGQNVRRYRCGKVLTKPSSAEREDVPDQDPGNDRRLGQPDGRRNDPAFESADQGLDHVSPLCGEQTHLYVRGSSDLPDGVALVPATAPKQEREVDQDELLPARRSSPLGLHRHAVRPERPRPADPVDGSSQGEDHSLREDPERRESLRSGVGTVPGSTAGLATGPNAGGSRIGSNISGRNRRDDAWSAVNRCGQQRKTARSIIGSGAAEAVRTRRTTWSCCMPTVIGRSTYKND